MEVELEAIQADPASQAPLLINRDVVLQSVSDTLSETFVAAGLSNAVSPSISVAVTNVVRAAIMTALPPMLLAADARNARNAGEEGDPAAAVTEITAVGINALTVIGMNDVQQNQSPPNKTYWTEILSIFVAVFSGLTSALALSVPGQTKVNPTIALILFVFNICLVITWVLKLVFERRDDNVSGFEWHYNTARANNIRIFYYKSISQFLGTLIVLSTVCLAVFVVWNSLMADADAKDHKREDLKAKRRTEMGKYMIAQLSIGFSSISASFQAYRLKRVFDLVQIRRENNTVVRRLRAAQNMPPNGRTDFLDYSRDVEPYVI